MLPIPDNPYFRRIDYGYGRNDVGKSAFLDALAIFFDQAKLDGDDLSIGTNNGTISISCLFSELPPDVILDAKAPTTLSGEYLLNASGQLEIKKTYNGKLAVPKLLGTFAVASHPTTTQYDNLHSLKNSNLKDLASGLSINLTTINQSYNTELRAAIWSHCPNLNIAPSEVALAAKDANNIWNSLSNYLPSFALFKSDRVSSDQDSEAQEPLTAAVKEALKSKQSALDALSLHVEKEVKKVALATLAKLKEMDSTLAADLSPNFKKPNWHSVFKVSLTDDTQVPINKRGSGVRRLILLNFFRAKAEEDAAKDDRPGTIYAIEEPETSQHPKNQVLLLSAFQDIASQTGNQVILTSHTPVLARHLDVQALRYIEGQSQNIRKIHLPSNATNKLISEDLGILPDHDVKVFVGMEGKNDIEYLCRISKILSDAGENIPDLNNAESSGKLVFIPLGGSNLALWVSRLAVLNRPEIHFFDRDTVPPALPKYESTVLAINAQPQSEAIVTSKLETENYIHPDAIGAAKPSILPLPTLGDYVDVPMTLADHIHSQSGSTQAWASLDSEKQKKKESRVKRWINRDAVDHMTPTLLSAIDSSDDIRTLLRKIGSHLV